MGRAAALVFVLAAGLVPASAHAKAQVIFTPPLGTVRAGTPTDVRMTIRTVAGERTANAHLVVPKPATPTLTLVSQRTGRSVTYTGSRSDRRGRSTVRVLVPRPGVWQPRVDMHGDPIFEAAPIYFEAPKQEAGGSDRTPTAQGASSDDGGDGFPGLLVGAAALVIVAAAATLLVRRHRPRPDAA
jgi:hypothetical protein